MSINVTNGYEQFYKGTEPIKNYGSGEKGRKDKVVKYEFNTTDEKGNKVMDKMSKEETLQAMKDIRSQYGDDVIVEFYRRWNGEAHGGQERLFRQTV